ncbi:class I tRNA ligase family protein, partial [Cronobacter sakazakii]|uniref:class I tRNA ligase family protein n=1 Tax=Cronobacter sakazakii TaxID=28141 RepID=UPI0039C856B3
MFASPAQSPRYSGFIERFFRTLLDRDALEERTTDQPFCTSCDRFAFEAHLRGRCSHCDAESDGGICEACGKPNAGADLVDPVCITCGGTPERRPLRQLWFPLERYRSAAEFTFACAWLSPRARALVA